MSPSLGVHQAPKQESRKHLPTAEPLPVRSSFPKQVTLAEQSGPTCVQAEAHQLGEKEPGGMADPPQPPWKFWLRVGSAAVGVGVGWLMFPVWWVSTLFFSHGTDVYNYWCRCLVYGNTAAGLWALFSSLPAGLVLYQHLRFKSASLAQTLPPSRLIVLRNVALVCSLVSGVATVAYPVTAIVNGQPMKPYSDSYVITGVWAFMSFKWSVGLAYFRYMNPNFQTPNVTFPAIITAQDC